uniref:Putative LOV domain-containing protein n=1 Tax=Rhizophora mucronata TaxID=61149 RepID=A0A2P2M8F0_RHIMU
MPFISSSIFKDTGEEESILKQSINVHNFEAGYGNPGFLESITTSYLCHTKFQSMIYE